MKNNVPISRHPLYRKWADIKTRCYNTSRDNYKHYGGRGITMFEPWINAPRLFISHVMGLPHYGEPGMSLDRMEGDFGYEPGNLRWVDQHTQNTNQRMKSNNKSGYIGVTHHKATGKWQASIQVNKRRRYIGIFSDIQDAIAARNDYITDNSLTEYKIQTYEETKGE